MEPIHPEDKRKGQKKSSEPKKKIAVGRWTDEEHRLFLEGLRTFPYRAWKKIATLIETRTVVQIRTHAQKYYQKLQKEEGNLRQLKEELDTDEELGEELPFRKYPTIRRNKTRSAKRSYSDTGAGTAISKRGKRSRLSKIEHPKTPTPEPELPKTPSCVTLPNEPMETLPLAMQLMEHTDDLEIADDEMQFLRVSPMVKDTADFSDEETLKWFDKTLPQDENMENVKQNQGEEDGLFACSTDIESSQPASEVAPIDFATFEKEYEEMFTELHCLSSEPVVLDPEIFIHNFFTCAAK